LKNGHNEIQINYVFHTNKTYEGFMKYSINYTHAGWGLLSIKGNGKTIPVLNELINHYAMKTWTASVV
jgi:hypothetical protein